jgi:two-component system, NtrC family, sensor histidine kinase PilS
MGTLGRSLTIVSAFRVALITLCLSLLLVRARLDPAERLEQVPTWAYSLVVVAYGLSVVYLVAIRRRRFILLSAYSQILIDSLMVTGLVWMTGGVESVFSFAYFLVVLAGSITLFRRGALIATFVGFFLYGTVLLLQLDDAVGSLPRVTGGRTAFAFVLHGSGLVVVAALASILSEKLRVTGESLRIERINLAQLSALHSSILASLPAGLVTIDGEGTIRFVNDAATAILAQSADDLVGRTLIDVAPAMMRGLDIRGSSIGGRREDQITRPDGQQIRVGFSRAPLGEQAGLHGGAVVVFQDLTEIVRLRRAAVRAEKLAAVGRTAASLAHEVRNPLASMCASIDVLRNGGGLPSSADRLMANVISEAERLNALITDFLDFAKPRDLSMAAVNLSAMIRSLAEVMSHDPLMAKHELVLELDSEVTVHADEPLVRQVIWNLVRNAAQAMPEGGPVQIVCRREQAGPTLIIRDRGAGMRPEQLERVFDPFYTTKAGGTGLGLAISHAIVEAHGAILQLESRPGVGTNAIIRFEAGANDPYVVSADLGPRNGRLRAPESLGKH